MNNAANLTPVSLVNATQWLLADATQDHVSLDTAVKPTGSSGSCRFNILNADTSASGNVGFYFGELRTFADGDTVWFSYRRRAGADFVYQAFFQDSGHADYTSNKLSILSWHKSSSMPNEVVVNESYGAGVVTGYYQNGLGSFIGVESAQVTACSNSDINAQPSIDRGANPLTGTNPDTGAAWTACEQARGRYGSLYSARSNPSAENYRRGFGDPFSGGFRQQPDEWITYTGRVQIGNFGALNNRYTLWAARDGQPYVKVFDGQNIRIGGAGNIPYDVLWLLPYRTYGVGGGRKVASRSNNIPGTTILACSRGLPLGAGTLEYNASTQRFRWAAAGDTFGPVRGFSIANDILTVNMTSASDKALTTLAGSITLPQASIVLTNAASFPNSGTVTISGVQVQYTGKSGNTLTGCSTTGNDSLGAGAAVRVESYLVLKINPAALPTSGIVADTLTIADGRPDTACWYADVIVSTQAINAPGGFAPVG